MSRTTAEGIRETYRGESGQVYAREFAQDEQAKIAIARERARKLQPHVPADASVLEYGVGQAYNLRFLQCRERWGFDVHDSFRDDCTRAGVTLVNSIDAFKGRTFDVVLCHHVLEHVPNPVATLNEIAGLLKPGGRFLLYVPFESRRRYRRYITPDPAHHLFSWNAQTIGNLLEATGFRIVDVRVQKFSYERRLAPLARFGTWAYRGGLYLLRTIRPEDEVFAVATL